MQKKISLILSFLFISSFLFGQEKSKTSLLTSYFLFNAGYSYQNGHFFEPGLDIYLVGSNDFIIDLGLSTNLGYMKENFVAIPEASIGLLLNKNRSAIDPYSNNFNSAFYVLRTSASLNHITPEVGVTILNLLELNAGYGFVYNKHEYADLDGFKVGLNIRLPFLLFWNN